MKYHYRMGDRIELDVYLQDGYQFGDYLDVCLPESLSRLHGGGQLKQFAVDLEGQSEVTIRLAATGRSLASDGERGVHHFMVLLRNMYDEERIGRPEMLQVFVN